MTRTEMIRLRRQMHRRIRAVVAERRMARLTEPSRRSTDQGTGAMASEHRDTCLIDS